jgi:hypothetical protein
LLSHLRREHAAFLASREYALNARGADLARYMSSWRDWLDALTGPTSGWHGAWVTGSGEISITPRTGGRYTVLARADDPIAGSYTCEFTGVGRVRGAGLQVKWDTKHGEEDGAERWTLVLQRRGSVLELEQRRNDSEAATAPFCGARGSLEGIYLPARVKPRPVRAWSAAGDVR